MLEQFIVDWQIDGTEQPAFSSVSLRMGGRKAGLYRVRAFTKQGILLSHGAISFPVGTQLDVEDWLTGIVPGDSIKQARVVANDSRGMRLAW